VKTIKISKQIMEGKMKRLIIIILITAMATGCTGRAVPEELSVSEHLELGYKYIEEGKYEEAILAFQNAIKIDEKIIEARIGLAEAYVGFEDFVKAEEVIKEAINDENENIELWDILISVYVDGGKDKEDIAELYLEAFERTHNDKYEIWIKENMSEKPSVNHESSLVKYEYENQLIEFEWGEDPWNEGAIGSCYVGVSLVDDISDISDVLISSWEPQGNWTNENVLERCWIMG
jgi:Tfp pilus assembly protein PilF